jgi:hypothetical protein
MTFITLEDKKRSCSHSFLEIINPVTTQKCIIEISITHGRFQRSDGFVLLKIDILSNNRFLIYKFHDSPNTSFIIKISQMHFYKEENGHSFMR